jgi:hypothetical protein
VAAGRESAMPPSAPCPGALPSEGVFHGPAREMFQLFCQLSFHRRPSLHPLLRCLEPGHRSQECPRQPAALRHMKHSHEATHPRVWRPVSSAAKPAQAASSGEAGSRQQSTSRRSRRKRRRPSRNASASAPLQPDLDRTQAPITTCFPCGTDRRPSVGRPLHVIDRSAALAWAEADLGHVLFISVGGSRPLVIEQQVLVEVERAFSVDPSSMVIMKTVPEAFLLVLPDLIAADRVFSRGLPLVGSGFTLFFKHWTQLALASNSALPDARVGQGDDTAHSK